MKPNILVISNYRDPVAPIRPEAEIFLRLKQLGFELTVITPKDGEYPQKLQDAGCTVIDYLPRGKFDLKAISLIRNAVRKHKINIIHAFNSKAIANAAWAVWNNKDVLLVSYRGYTGNIHRFDPANYLSFLNPRIDYMVCLAESVREQYIRNGVSPDKTVTIHKGHDASWYSNIAPADLRGFNIQPGTTVCALVANFRIRMKGIHFVVEAAAMLPNSSPLVFLMIGEGLDTPEILRNIKALGVRHRFIFTGFRNDVRNLVKAADIVLSASLFGEATQKAVIEAMYLGKAMIITDISGNRGMVENGDSGIVVPPGDAKAISDALMTLHNNPDMRKAMGEKAAIHIARFLSIDKSVEEYAEFYTRIASK